MYPRSLLAIATVLSTAYLAASVDPKCPKGTVPGFEYNAFQFNVPYTTIFDKMGSFLDAQWLTGPLNSTTGKDRTVGATRTNTFAGTVISEELIEYETSTGRFYQRYILSNGPIAFQGANLPSYTEELSAISICGGNASFILFTGVFCADKPNQIYDFYQAFRRGAMGGVAQELKAKTFDGTCPLGP